MPCAAAAEEDSGQAKDGDPILQELSRYRGLMIPQKDWPLALRQFEAKWGLYKQALGLMDFTDLIERRLHDAPFAPTAPAVIFADEAQDLNRMQLTLIRKWGERANYFTLKSVEERLKKGRTVMFLAACSYMLHPVAGRPARRNLSAALTGFQETGYPLDSGNRSGSSLVGQTIVFCRLSTPGRFSGPTDHKKRWSVPPWTATAHLSQVDSHCFRWARGRGGPVAG